MIIVSTLDFLFLIKFKIQIDSQGTGFWFGVYSWPRILYGPLAGLELVSRATPLISLPDTGILGRSHHTRPEGF